MFSSETQQWAQRMTGLGVGGPLKHLLPGRTGALVLFSSEKGPYT